MTHDFYERLAFSQGSNISADIEILRRAIPNCVCVRKTSLKADRAGVDYIAQLAGGAEIGIDAKLREKGASAYWTTGEAELALETWSVFPDGKHTPKEGWTLSTAADVDLILFRFHPADWPESYLLPFQMLRMAFKRKRADWETRYPKKIQDSGDWFSQALFVPVSVVLRELMCVMQIRTGSERH